MLSVLLVKEDVVPFISLTVIVIVQDHSYRKINDIN